MHCRHCGAPNRLGHDKICTSLAPWTVVRHGLAKSTPLDPLCQLWRVFPCANFLLLPI
jgi:hypothetical protein